MPALVLAEVLARARLRGAREGVRVEAERVLRAVRGLRRVREPASSSAMRDSMRAVVSARATASPVDS